MTTGELITKVQHDYRDHALVNDGKTVAEAQLQGRLGDLKPSCHRSDRTFPVILHYMLSELEAKGVSHIISWQPHGRCFQVHKNKEFVDHILPL